jgi:hypothetical protein
MPARPQELTTLNHNQMKIFSTIALVAVLTMVSIFGRTETESGSGIKQYSESLIKRFEVLPDREAFQLWQNSLDPVAAGNGMIDSSLENKRIGILKLFFDDEVGCDALLRALSKMPESVDKDLLVVMMLRWDSRSFWQNEELQKDISNPLSGDWSAGSGLPRPNAIEPFVGLIRKYLPHVGINEKLFSTKEKRMKLAADLENAMSGGSPTHRGERPKKRNELPEAVETQTSANQESSKQPAVSKTSPQSTLQSTSFLRWAWVAGLLMVGSLLWMLSKKRKCS